MKSSHKLVTSVFAILFMSSCGSSGSSSNKTPAEPAADAQLRSPDDIIKEMLDTAEKTKDTPAGPELPPDFFDAPTVPIDDLTKDLQPLEFLETSNLPEVSNFSRPLSLPLKQDESNSKLTDFTGQIPFIFSETSSLLNDSNLKYSSADLRKNDTPVVSQEDRPWCTAFATTASLENIAASMGKPFKLSEEQHWSTYKVYYMNSSADAAQKTGVADYAKWPWRKIPTTTDMSAAVKIKSWKHVPKLDEVRNFLDKGIPLQVGMSLNESFNRNKGGVISPYGRRGGGHAMSVVGYHDDPKLNPVGGGYLIIKNSWSKGWGNAGYAYIPYQFCVEPGSRCNFMATTAVEINGEPMPMPIVEPSPGSRARPNPAPGRPANPVNPPAPEPVDEGICEDLLPLGPENSASTTTVLKLPQNVSKILSIRGTWTDDTTLRAPFTYEGIESEDARLSPKFNYGALLFTAMGTNASIMEKLPERSKFPVVLGRPTHSFIFRLNGGSEVQVGKAAGKLRICFAP